MATVCISDIRNAAFDNCDAAAVESTYRIEKVFGTSVNPPMTKAYYDGLNKTGCVMFSCDDYNRAQFQGVRLWVIDRAGNANYVVSTITLQDNAGACRPSANIAGAIRTESNAAVANVTVSATTGSTIAASNVTSATGEYVVSGLALGNYQVKAAKTDVKDAYTGVTTFDILRVQKHLLGLENLGSAYQMIAADVNKDGEVDGADMLHLRNFILRKSNSLPGGIWRFIDKSYSFKNASNPFAEDFSEVATLNDLKAGTSAASFVAVKLGDVNQNYSANATASVVRNAQVLNFTTADRVLSAGNEYTVNIDADNFNAAAFQGTLSFNGATVKSVKAAEGLTDGNFGMFNNAVTMSWNGNTELKGIVAVTFVANKTAKLSDVLTLGSELTPAEANTTTGSAMNVALKFTNGKVSGEFALYQNTPNPVSNETSIRFNLPSETTAKLTVYDVQGKVVLVKNGAFAAGVNEFVVNKSELNANGVLYYRLDTPEHSATKKMIIME
jgi:hypothetical protein